MGTALAEAMNAAAWAVSFTPAGADTIHTVSLADGRDHRLEGLRLKVDNDVYPVDDFPATARLMAAGAGTFVVRVDDEEADRAERDILAKEGRLAVLTAAAADHDGTWLLEIYADEQSVALEEGHLEAGLLVRAAVPPRPAGKGGTALLERRTRQLALISGLAARLATSGHPTEMIVAVAEELHTGDGRGRHRRDARAARGARRARRRAGHGSRPRPVRDPCLSRLQPARRSRPDRALHAREPPGAHLGRVERARLSLDGGNGALGTRRAGPGGGRSWGAITVQDVLPGAFDDEDARLLASVADQLAAALRAAALYDQLERAYLGTAEALSAALEAKDSYTAEHSRSLVQRAEAVGRLLEMDETELRVVRYGAAFHDIGKLAVPEQILNKPGPLTTGERSVVQRHTVVGEQILSPVEFLSDVLPLVRSAHECFDGSGYPDGLAGEEIPLGARIVFACDTYDAMTTDRPYRKALPHEQAVEELRRVAGSQLDPRVVEALIAVLG